MKKKIKSQLEFRPEAWDAKFISGLRDEQLIIKLPRIHDIFVARGSNPQDEEVINAYILLTDEIKKRKLEFSVIPELEKLANKLRESIQEWIINEWNKLRDIDEVSRVKAMDEIAEKLFKQHDKTHYPLSFWKEFVLKQISRNKLEEGYLDGFLLDKIKEIQKTGNIILVPNYVNWTGSTLYAKDRMPNDLDIVIRDEKINPDWMIKVQRLMKKIMETEPCYHLTATGPNWRHLPVLHLGLIPVKEPQFVEMGKEEPGFADLLYEQVLRAASPEVQKQAEMSAKQDRIKMFRFFQPMKPTRSAKPNHRMTIDFFLSLFKEEDFKAGILSSKKYDGMAIIIYKDGDKIEIWSEDGENLTERLPQTIEAIKKLNRDELILLAELELWLEGKHQPREAVSGLMKEKGKPDDSNVVANIFTKVWENKDIHKEPEFLRQEGLKKINFPQSTWGVPDVKKKLNLVPNLLSHSKEELRKHTNFVWKQVASEGNVAKKSNSIFYLDGRSRDGWIKWHGNALLYGTVIKRNPTKVETVFNYDYGILPTGYKIDEKDLVEVEGKKYVKVGTTFNTDEKKNKGDMIAVECETFNFITDRRTNTVGVTAWAPRYIYLDKTEEPVPKVADTIGEVVEKAKKNRVLQKKTITKEGETLYESTVVLYDDEDDYLPLIEEEIPKDIYTELELEKEKPSTDFKEFLQEAKKPLDEYSKNSAILVNHFRGKSVHLDFRRKQNGFLEGETILNAPAGLVTEEVDTVAKGKKWNAELLAKGKFRPDMDPTKKAVLVGKARQPLEWINVREVSYPPGSVGATKWEWGTFVTMDEGMAYPGVQRVYFKEFFLDMKHFKKQRMVERLLGVSPEWEKKPKGPTQWQTWITLEEVPYILTKRQRKDKRDYIPKEEEKAIPPWWEEKIKPEHKWWLKDLPPKERMKRLDLAYNDLIEKGLIKARPIEMKEEDLREKTGKFILRWHWWMGPKVIRELPAADSRFELLIDTGKNVLDRWDFTGKFYGDPTKQDETNATRKTLNIQTPNGEPFRNWMEWEGSIPAKDSILWQGKVLKALEDNKYLVEDSKTDGRLESKPTFAKFKISQVAWMDQWDNLYTGNKGGTAYGNPNERIPAYIEIKDEGTVEWIEDTAQFSSFKFNGKLLKGYWVARSLDPKQNLWVFSRGKLPGEKIEITKEEFYSSETSVSDFDTPVNLSDSKFPIEIEFQSNSYNLVSTKNGKLLLNKN